MNTTPTITLKDGTQLYYKDWGTGQPLMFHHGWPLSADDWDAQTMFFLAGLLKTERNPDGIPLAVFDGLRGSTAQHRAQFYQDFTLPFYGYNRPADNLSVSECPHPGPGRHSGRQNATA